MERLLHHLKHYECNLITGVLHYMTSTDSIKHIKDLLELGIISASQYNYTWYVYLIETLKIEINKFDPDVDYNMICSLEIFFGNKDLCNITGVNENMYVVPEDEQDMCSDNNDCVCYDYEGSNCIDQHDENCKRMVGLIRYFRSKLDSYIFNNTLIHIATFNKGIIIDNSNTCVNVLGWLTQLNEEDIVKTLIAHLPSGSYDYVLRLIIKYIPNNVELFELVLNKADNFDASLVCSNCYTYNNILYLDILKKIMNEKNMPKLKINGNMFPPDNITLELINKVYQLHDDNFKGNERTDINNYGRFCEAIDYFDGFKQYIDGIDTCIITKESANYCILIDCVMFRLIRYLDYMLEYFVTKGIKVYDPDCRVIDFFPFDLVDAPRIVDISRIGDTLNTIDAPHIAESLYNSRSLMEKYIMIFKLEKECITSQSLIRRYYVKLQHKDYDHVIKYVIDNATYTACKRALNYADTNLTNMLVDKYPKLAKYKRLS